MEGFNVFLDTEFTTLGDKLNLPRLISIACVAQDGREFYAEVSDSWHEGLCSDFVVQNVLPFLEGGECRMTEAILAVRIKLWIESLTEDEAILRTDSPRYDWPHVAELFHFYGCWPKNLRRKCGTIFFEEEHQQLRYEEGLEIFWKSNAMRQHHALIDAKSLLFAWNFAVKIGV